MRAFIALRLSPDVQSSLASLQQTLHASGANVKWVEPRNLHVTMKFLGEITEDQQRAVEALLRRVASEEGSFLLGLEGVGAFPSVRAPRVIWAGISEGKDAVLRLAAAIEREGAGLLPKEDLPAPRQQAGQAGRPFAAHVTLGRVRSPRHRQELTRALQAAAWTPPPACQMSALTLYQSVLGSAGPTYTALGEFPLKK